MKLSDYLELDEKDIISIVGAGGKTTLMFILAEELRNNYKVLVTTTTKIYAPSNEKYDFICTDKEKFYEYIEMKDNGIYVLGLGVNAENKVLGLTEESLDKLTPYFDYVLIESDGSKKKQLKGWNEFEPVVFSKTTKTIGIVDIKAIEMEINEEKVHRSNIFCNITGAHQGEKVKVKHLFNLITHPKGLFKGAQGERILYINKVESQEDLTLAQSLLHHINMKSNTKIEKQLIGSLNNKIFF